MLVALTPVTRIFVAVAPVDLRRSFDGLSAHVQAVLNQQVMEGGLFVFTNRRRHQTTFNIPIRHRSRRVPVASTARTAIAGSPAKGTERDRSH